MAIDDQSPTKPESSRDVETTEKRALTSAESTRVIPEQPVSPEASPRTLDRRRFLGLGAVAAAGGLVAYTVSRGNRSLAQLPGPTETDGEELPGDSMPSPEECTTESLFEALSIWDAPRGGSRTEILLLMNIGTVPIHILDVAADRPEFFADAFDPMIPPGEFGAVPITLAPGPDDVYSGNLTVLTDDASGLPLLIPLEGTASDPVDTPLSASVEIEVGAPTVLVDGDGVHVHYTVELPPTGPTQADAWIQLSVVGSLPPGAVAVFSNDFVPLVGHEVVALEIFAPVGTPPTDANFVVEGQVIEDGFPTFTTTSVAQFLDSSTFAQVADPCACNGAPAPTLNELDKKEFKVPDAQPPRGVKPSARPIALVTALVEGPKKGECCLGAKFKMTLTIDSQEGAASNPISAWLMLAALCGKHGFSVKADTDGGAQTVGRGSDDSGTACADLPKPADIRRTPTPRVELKTEKEIKVTCEGDKWPCKVPKKKFKTTLKLSGAEAGSIEVFWSIDISGENCIVDTVSGKIDQIIYLHMSDDRPPKEQVHDPINDEFLDKGGDADSDGKSNYDEVKAGTDPKKP